MKEVKLIGWGSFDYEKHNKEHEANIPYTQHLIEEMNCDESFLVRDKAEKLIVEDIRENNWWFSGENHQYCDNGTPIVEYDGKRYYFLVSWRTWGGIMAYAHNTNPEYNGSLDYMDFYMGTEKEKEFKMPPKFEEVKE